MQIKNVDVYAENFKPRRKNVVQTISAVILTASLAISPIVAQAAVLNDEILGDAQVTEDRQGVKYHDAYQINAYFYGYDEYGCATVTLDSLLCAMEMSDALNLYNGCNLEAINTTKAEVLGLNIPALYTEFKANPGQFAASHQGDRSAIDAYITFGTRTVGVAIRDELARRVYGLLKAQGKNVTKYPYITITEREVSALYEVDGHTEKAVIYGDRVEDIKSQCLNMEEHYDIALHSINGTSDKYENNFAYNGVRKGTGESVWLSMGSDDLKDEEREAIAFTKGLQQTDSYDLVAGTPKDNYTMSSSEAESLRQQGYNIPDLDSVPVNVVFIVNVPKLQY